MLSSLHDILSTCQNLESPPPKESIHLAIESEVDLRLVALLGIDKYITDKKKEMCWELAKALVDNTNVFHVDEVSMRREERIRIELIVDDVGYTKAAVRSAESFARASEYRRVMRELPYGMNPNEHYE